MLVSADATSREEAAGLAAHMFQIIRLSRVRGFKWLRYDTEYRQWEAAKNVKIYGGMNMSIYGRCLPQVVDLGSSPLAAETNYNSQNSCKIPAPAHATGGTVINVLSHANLGMCALSVEMHTGKETAQGLKRDEDHNQAFTSTV